MRDKLNKWADLLLDTGKRNNLINFKDSKLNTLEVVTPDINKLFLKAEHGARFEVYDPLIDDEEDILFGGVDEQSLSIAKKLVKEAYVDMYAGKIKKSGQILAHNSFTNPIKAIKNIGKKAKTAIEETGVNIAYMAFGFINWTEDGVNFMRAPILLVPITIENESSITPFYVKVTDDDIIVNPTFSFKLQNEYGIKLPDYEDEGLDNYFEKILSNISKLNWSIDRSCKIAIFSFLKINMHKDLKDNADIILNNSNIRALLGEGNLDYGTNICEENKNGNPLIDLHNVVDADSSQTEAIELAKAGKSFVLQGPPGTGKSQTITNIIAECLFSGKKVLFVSEKLAALNVVFDKLKKAGLNEFCLELHSHKANKKDVINELCKTLKMQKSALSKRAEQELESKERAQNDLDGYSLELHKIHPLINKSLFEVYQEIASCRTSLDVDFVIDKLEKRGEEYFSNAQTALNRYVEYIPSIGYDYTKNVWFGYKDTDCTYLAVTELKKNLDGGISLCERLLEINDKLKENYSFTAINIQSAYTLREFFNLIKDSKFFAPILLNGVILDSVIESVQKLNKYALELNKAKLLLNNDFDEDIFKLNGKDYYKKLTKQYYKAFSRLFSGEYRRIVKDIKLCLKNPNKVSFDKAVNAMDTLKDYQYFISLFDAEKGKVIEFIGDGFNGVDTDFGTLMQELTLLKDYISKIKGFGSLQKLSKTEFELKIKIVEDISNNLNKCLNKHCNVEEKLLSCFDESLYNVRKVSIENLKIKYENCLQNVDQIDNWCSFTALLQDINNLKLKTYIDFVIKNNIEANQIVSVFKKAFYTQWANLLLHQSPLLFRLSRVPHDESVNQFRAKDELNFEINKATIRAELSALRPNLDIVAQGSATSILIREGEKKRKQKNIRALLSEIGELALILKPCFLMSPLSVSTFLSADMHFDVVVFDEASQIFPQDAIGAIYRGSQLIVVGDSKQMPPSNFFNSMSAMEEDDDELEDVTDFESILDLCSVAFPQKRLKWHYRSRYEGLISFSNKNFYESDLVTFPSSKNDKFGIGVDFFYVNGIFDRKTKTNRMEAEFIADLVFENIEKFPNRSLGVVAFSISQQNLIDKLIYKRRQLDPSKEWFFKADNEEPFFVKNLETVQGDERDTIIFSIAYAKDIQGRLLYNFGPINREGGERRLNVAITRAKSNVQVVSSMKYSDIDLSRTKSVGAKLLRDYLGYAENGEMSITELQKGNNFETDDIEFETEVFEFLKENGFTVDMQVGCSSFKIDMAVKNSITGDYVLAIECDGKNYKKSKNARDRDRLRQSVLENMGWQYYRIWSTDWFRNKRVEKDRLIATVKGALKGTVKKEIVERENVSFEEVAVSKQFEFPKYLTFNVQRIASMYNYDIKKVIYLLIKFEAPISEEWLLKRLLFLFKREKITSAVKTKFESYLKDCKENGVLRKDGFLYLSYKPVSMLRVANGDEVREIKYIPLEELANGMREVLRQNGAIEKESLYRVINEQLGFSRMGETTLKRFDDALNLILSEVECNGSVISLKK